MTLSQIITNRLKAAHDALQDQFITPNGSRTRAFVLDDVLPLALAQEVARALPVCDAGMKRRSSLRELKSTSANLELFHPVLGDLLMAQQAPEVVSAIAEITGLKGLEADPLLYASGLSMMRRGDFLNPHIDNSHDSERKRYRRLNLLYYATPDWSEDDGGNLELWDESVRRPTVIVSRFNRLVVMETTRVSWHSVQPVAAPRNRWCVSNYYFSQSPPGGLPYFHATEFTGRPDQIGRRALLKADAMARTAVADLLGIGRGR